MKPNLVFQELAQRLTDFIILKESRNLLCYEICYYKDYYPCAQEVKSHMFMTTRETREKASTEEQKTRNREKTTTCGVKNKKVPLASRRPRLRLRLDVRRRRHRSRSRRR